MERIKPQEFLDSLPDEARRIYEGLNQALINHQNLGLSGPEEIQKNQFGETALRADLEAEKKILETVKEWVTSQSHIALRYLGEEVGSGVLGQGKEEWFLVIDGLDGSANYQAQDKAEWPYGTMVALAKGGNPRYEDFLVAGITLPEENWLALGVKERGVFLFDLKNDEVTQLPAFPLVTYNDQLILADDFYPEAKQFIGPKNRKVWPRTGSVAASYVALVLQAQVTDKRFGEMNQNWQALVDVTRKGNLEQPVGFLFLNLLGGKMIDSQGQSIGKKRFLTWGQDSHQPVILAINDAVIFGLAKSLPSFKPKL